MKKFPLIVFLVASLAGCGQAGTMRQAEAPDPRDTKIARLERQLREEQDVNQALAGAVDGSVSAANTAMAQAPQAPTPPPPSVPVATPAPAPAPVPAPSQSWTFTVPNHDRVPAPAPAPGNAMGFIPQGMVPPVMPGFYGGTVGPAVGYLDRDPMDGRPCGGMCMALRRSQFYMHVIVDGREMAQVFSGIQPLYRLANKALPGGGRMVAHIPVVPPGQRVMWAMDAVGLRQVTVVLYTAVPGNPVLQPVGVWDDAVRFPYRNGSERFDWGVVRDGIAPERDISRY